MTELIRPMLYQAYHVIENLSQESRIKNQDNKVLPTGEDLGGAKVSPTGGDLEGAGTTHYDVVGPICESTDCFRKDVELPESFRGDLIAIRTAGAYGEVMASRYNLRDAVQSVYSE